MEVTMSNFGRDLLAWVCENNVQRFSGELQLNRAINARFGGNPKGKRYPADCYSGTCDVAVPTKGDRFGWVEVKYAQTYFSQKDFRRDNYKLFEKYVFSTSTNEHSVRNDLILKLGSLIGQPCVEYVGMLVVFLYSDLYPLPNNTFSRLDAITSPNTWRKETVPAWSNPDHQEVPSYILPVYWERSAAAQRAG
jgi:hypothetical protein